MDFRLPALGEGIDSATVVGIRVKPGDAVHKDQEVIDVETDKAAVPVPIDRDGIVEVIHVKPGDKIPIGTLLLTLATAAKQSASAPAPSAGASSPTPPTATHNAPASATGGTSPSMQANTVAFKLPPLGEGIDTATVVAVKIKPGDVVSKDQEILDVETDKAAVPVPIDLTGTVTEVHVKPGDKIGIGSVVAVIATSPGTVPASPRLSSPGSLPGSSGSLTPPVPGSQTSLATSKAFATTSVPGSNGVTVLVPAGPATRRLARELGVALSEIKGTARGGRVTIDDVKSYVKHRLAHGPTSAAGSVTGSIVDVFALPPLPDFAKYGDIEKKPVPKIRETIAKNLTIAWRTMPMVTQHDLADITELEAGRKRIVDALPKGAPKITMTVLAVKAVVAALKEFPNFNSSYDMNAGELVLKKYYHIGIAVDTERGLVVPVIRDADKKSIREIAAEVVGLAEKARAGKLAIEDMRGGTFTITNLGGIGGTAFTPIVNYPEVAILGLSRSAWQPVVRDGQIVPRLMMPMSLTYDHRVVDGADGARFTSRLAQLFSDPIRLLMES